MSCTSCGAEVDHVQAIRRKYVTAAGWDQEPSERVVDEIEYWCFPCLTHYPHEIVEDPHEIVEGVLENDLESLVADDLEGESGEQ